MASDAGTEATSVYAADGTPIAWAGRPSDIAADRIRAAGEDWFVLEQVLGLRLVHIRSVDRRLGAVVVTERSVGAASPATAMASLRGSGPDPYRLNTRWATVALEAASGDARTSFNPSRFEIAGPHARPLLTATVDDTDLVRTRDQWAAAVRWAMLAIIAAAVLFVAGAVLDWRAMIRAAHPGLAAIGLLGCVALARAVLMVAPAASWSSLPLFTAVTYASPAVPRLLSSPLDFLLTAIALIAMVLVALQWVETCRRRRRGRQPVGEGLATASAGALLAGIAAAFVLQGHAWVLRDTVAHSTLDPLHFSLAPFSAARLALQLGLIAVHAAAVTALVTLFRVSTNPWLVARWSAAQAALVTAWVLPTVIWSAARAGEAPAGTPMPGVELALTLAVLLTLSAPAVWARYRNGSQGFRLVALALAPVVPALAFYPSVFAVAWRAKSDLVENRYAPQALNQRATVYSLLEESLARYRRAARPGRARLRRPVAGSIGSGERSRVSALADHGARALPGHVLGRGATDRDGRLLSRFAFNLPEDLSAVPAIRRSGRAAGRWPRRWRRSSPTSAASITPAALCCGRGRHRRGSIVVHAMLDYENLPFIASRTPVRRAAAAQRPRPARPDAGRRRANTRSTGGAAAPLLVARHRMAARGRRLRAGRAVARAGLGAAAAQWRAIRRVPAERPRRHLRARVPRGLRARTPGRTWPS